jgi:hypothetical protein
MGTENDSCWPAKLRNFKLRHNALFASLWIRLFTVLRWDCPKATMNSIFVSCGQYTQAESLGKAIVRTVKSVTGLDAFFAEEVQDLNGLDANVLAALHDCTAFIFAR